MNLYFAGTSGLKNYAKFLKGLHILESFVYIKPWQIEHRHEYKSFMMDSGAFTFLKKSKKNVDWVDYTKRYAEFINKHNIDLYMEMDIDSIVGTAQVEKLRHVLETETGKPSIPVWHKVRGKQYWLDMVKEYDYVAVGGIDTDSFTKKHDWVYPWFTSAAHEQGVKVHGLGYTRSEGMLDAGFDSTDATTWLYSSRMGHPMFFLGDRMTKQSGRYAPKNRRCIVDKTELMLSNLSEWKKFSEYLESR